MIQSLKKAPPHEIDKNFALPALKGVHVYFFQAFSVKHHDA